MYPADFKLRFQKALLAGTPSPVDIDPETAERWTMNLNEQKPLSLDCLNGRYLNTFMVGSDPEFCFSKGNRKQVATELGLKPALAFGSDQNARLVELRPAPSRSVVEHVASLLVTLRYMLLTHPIVLNYGWRCGAFFDGDGMGGHVHFGRKRPTRAAEVAGLDGLARVLRSYNMFPEREWAQRAMGDARNQVYGAYGDFRIQAHGYEYRTLPSWLRNPAIAFAVIAASKLVVLDPAVTTNWEPCTVAEAGRRLLALAKLYAGRDDDARILYHLLLTQSERLRHTSGCFRAAWGLEATLDTDPNTGQARLNGMVCPTWDYIPTMLWPTPEDSGEVLNHLIDGTPLTFHVNDANFHPRLPKGFTWLYAHMNNTTRPGTGDFFCDLVQNVKHPFAITTSDHHNYASEPLLSHPKIKELIPNIQRYPHGTDLVLAISRGVLADLPRARALKKFLLSGIVPLWTTQTATAEALKAYKPPATVKAPALVRGKRLL